MGGKKKEKIKLGNGEIKQCFPFRSNPFSSPFGCERDTSTRVGVTDPSSLCKMGSNISSEV